MTKVIRHFSHKKQIDDVELRRLWSSKLTDDAMAKRLGYSRSTLRRRAIKIGLPSRREIWANIS